MNTTQQLEKTFEDYQNAKNGFEHRKNWQSKIRELSKGKKIEDL